MRINLYIIRLHSMLQVAGAALLLRLAETALPRNRERGDVPGWVMITLMSAVLVAGLLAVATPALEAMFTDAMNRVAP